MWTGCGAKSPAPGALRPVPTRAARRCDQRHRQGDDTHIHPPHHRGANAARRCSKCALSALGNDSSQLIAFRYRVSSSVFEV